MDNPKGYPVQLFKDRMEDVHYLLGFPLNVVSMDDVLSAIDEAARTRRRLFISTANMNFVTLAQSDKAFRVSLHSSDLCVADGIAVKLLGKLLGIPIRHRVAGSDILDAVCNSASTAQDSPLKVFFFGGTEEAGRLASDAINRHPSGNIVCVGNFCPGFGTIEEMSGDSIIQTINRAKPDFLIVSLGARKGQAWIMHNMAKLEAPVISHLGATINFIAGTIERAPAAWQSLGLEWLWRIRQEPALAGRYWRDGIALLKLLLTRVAPLRVWFIWRKWRWRAAGFSVQPQAVQLDQTTLVLEGNFTSSYIGKFDDMAAKALMTTRSVCVDLSAVNVIDTRAMGSLQSLSETVRKNDGTLLIKDAPASLRWALRTNGMSNLAVGDS